MDVCSSQSCATCLGSLQCTDANCQWDGVAQICDPPCSQSECSACKNEGTCAAAACHWLVQSAQCSNTKPVPVAPPIKYPVYSDLSGMNWTIMAEMDVTMPHFDGFDEQILAESIAMVAGTSYIDVT
eukprot:COSAG01_NODE_27357_length_687_cov_69.523810_1_plen_126_part_01